MRTTTSARTESNVNMVRSCVVYKCFNKADGKGKQLSFFRFPKNKRKRQAWIKAVNRAGWLPTEASYICSEHFEGGWHSDDPEDNNYRPTIFSYKEQLASVSDEARKNRRCKRNLEQVLMSSLNKIQRHAKSIWLLSSLIYMSYKTTPPKNIMKSFLGQF